MDKDKLLKKALEARENAYAPYSNFKVGAAVLTANNKIYCGANVENVSYGLSMCAERNAIANAIVVGERDFVAIAIVADTDKPVSPCGACRQVLAEFNVNMIVIMTNLHGDIKETSVAELLPVSFDKF